MQTPLKIYNSLTSKKETFKSLHKNKIGMYVCGMTVYDYCHIGHARILVVFDVIARHLRNLNYDLTYIRNITDIDDKIIKRANENNQNIAELTQFFIEKMDEDEKNLGNIAPNFQPKATAHIKEIITMIEKLIEKKLAYISNNGTVYFETRKFKQYGKLSGKKLDELLAGARIEVDESKKDSLDFVLWKPSKENEPFWQSPWGKGRPGWHIECSAMSCNHLGNHFDLHGGGVDLKFPHHENEIAQSIGATDEKFVNHWIHIGFVNVNNEKMSKSLGNFFTIREVFKHYHPEVVRTFLLGTHYRKPLNYSDENLNLAKANLNRLYNSFSDSFDKTKVQKNNIIQSYVDKFNNQMSDDFNTPGAFAVLFDLTKKINQQKDLLSKNDELSNEKLNQLESTLYYLANQLGLLTQNPADFFTKKTQVNAQEIELKINQRNEARKNKNFALADAIRDELKEKGIVLEDLSGKTNYKILDE